MAAITPAKLACISLFVLNERGISLEEVQPQIEAQNPNILLRSFPRELRHSIRIGPTEYRRAMAMTDMGLYLPTHQDKDLFNFEQKRGSEVEALTIVNHNITIVSMIQDKSILLSDDFVRRLKMFCPEHLMVVAHSYYPRTVFHISLTQDSHEIFKPAEEGYFQLLRK